jgi:peptide-methionine (S)-S-oxide reductase
MALTTLGGGCFWCLEAVFQRLKGVRSVVSGYAGGDPAKANYKAVCTGASGHTEVVQIDFDDSIITFRDLLSVYFAIHDPTTPNRQGADVGPQYRSEIFAHDDDQMTVATAFLAEMTPKFSLPIVTKLTMLDRFYSAEEYHQNYFNDNPYQPYCIGVVAPKVAKAEKLFPQLLK